MEIKKNCVYLLLQVEEVERLECTDIYRHMVNNIKNTAFDTLYLSKDNIECGFEVKPADDNTSLAGFLFWGRQDIYGKGRWVFSTVRPINLKRQVKKLRPIRGERK